MDELTLTKMICSARDIDPELGKIKGACAFCGNETEHGFGFNHTGQFTTYQHIMGGDCVCEYCYAVRSSQEYRRSMWCTNDKEFTFFKLKQAKQYLQNPPKPPFVMYFTENYKQQGWPLLVNRINHSQQEFIVGLDYSMVLVEAEVRDNFLEFAQFLIDRGFTKTEMLTGKLRHKSYLAVDFDHDIIKKISYFRDNPLWRLCCYVTRKEYDDQ